MTRQARSRHSKERSDTIRRPARARSQSGSALRSVFALTALIALAAVGLAGCGTYYVHHPHHGHHTVTSNTVIYDGYVDREVWYHDPHPVHVVDGTSDDWCPIHGPHSHPYHPEHSDTVYTHDDDGWVFIGDPADYVDDDRLVYRDRDVFVDDDYQIGVHPYHDPHPTSSDGVWCPLDGDHSHTYHPDDTTPGGDGYVADADRRWRWTDDTPNDLDTIDPDGFFEKHPPRRVARKHNPDARIRKGVPDCAEPARQAGIEGHCGKGRKAESMTVPTRGPRGPVARGHDKKNAGSDNARRSNKPATRGGRGALGQPSRGASDRPSPPRTRGDDTERARREQERERKRAIAERKRRQKQKAEAERKRRQKQEAKRRQEKRKRAQAEREHARREKEKAKQRRQRADSNEEDDEDAEPGTGDDGASSGRRGGKARGRGAGKRGRSHGRRR